MSMIMHGTYDQDERTIYTAHILKLQHEECYSTINTVSGLKNVKCHTILNTCTENKR